MNKKGSEGWVKVICDLFNYVYCVYVCITVCLMCLCVWTHVWYVCLCMCMCVSVWVCNQRCSWCSNAVKEIRAAASSHVIGEFLRNMFATAALPVWPPCRGFDLQPLRLVKKHTFPVFCAGCEVYITKFKKITRAVFTMCKERCFLVHTASPHNLDMSPNLSDHLVFQQPLPVGVWCIMGLSSWEERLVAWSSHCCFCWVSPWEQHSPLVTHESTLDRNLAPHVLPWKCWEGKETKPVLQKFQV